MLEHIDLVRPVAHPLIEPSVATLAERLAEPGMLETFLTIQASRLHRLIPLG